MPAWDAIARHLAGESPADESAVVGAWLSEHPEEGRAFEWLASASARMGQEPGEGVDVESALRRVHERMRAPAVPSMPVIPLLAAARSARRVYLPWAVAAAAVLIITVGIVQMRKDGTTDAARVVSTATGQIDSTRLTDGTRVILGPSSELSIARGYSTGRREVRLRGTAQFAVRHDAAHPFTVRAGEAVITDIGTVFTVRGDSMEGVEVSVREGSVRVQRAGGATAVLAAGDLATLPQAGTLVVRRAAASEDDVAWTRGRLVFRETPLTRVRSDLRRWFGVELIVADSSLAARHLTASFNHDSRQQVFNVIALALGASYDVRGDTVTLRPASLTARPHR